MIIKSEQYVYDRMEERYTYPLVELDTMKRTVTSIDPETYEKTITQFHSEFTRPHLRYVEEHDIGRLKKLVNDRKIIGYLEDFENKCFDIIDSQVEKWKEGDKEFQVAIMNGDIVKAAGLANNLTEMAKEIVKENVVYR